MTTPSTSRPAGVATVQLDDGRVKVTQWRLAPGTATGWHRHAHDTIVVPITGGRLQVDDGRETRYAELTAGQSYSRPMGVEHDVGNASDHEIVFVEIELR
ncbi:MAG TPA: cupin domain-containing protein [Anaeromyxobacteraceae bacterium]|nr:cupin domain-containing protein [Anaeromyxobacteraceae bacterium]